MEHANRLQNEILLDSELETIRNHIEAAERSPLFLSISFCNKYHFASEDGETELGLTAMCDQLVVSRVLFRRRRQGTLTTLLPKLTEICKAHQLNQIVIQSVLTPEMAKWCIKNGFSPHKYHSYSTYAGIIGDYLLDVF